MICIGDIRILYSILAVGLYQLYFRKHFPISLFVHCKHGSFTAKLCRKRKMPQLIIIMCIFLHPKKLDCMFLIAGLRIDNSLSGVFDKLISIKASILNKKLIF